ncbi:MAG: glycosyltransferase family 4 protein [Verrucomicrobia bacterium]|nr:glycosyltransferase family 4 protein [Verrucomicrobiota bacterium]MCF7708552.1 glycosyltransferase family 4 protein [Verrucomicrobiota bacterium]
MRVVHVITRLIVGGAQENTVDTVLGLRKAFGVDATLVSGPTYGPEGSLERVFDNEPAGVLTVLPGLVRPINPALDIAAFFRLYRLFKARQPDIVHTHSGKAGILGRLAAASARVPVIIHSIHGPSFGAFQGVVPNFIFKTTEKLAGRVTTHFVAVSDAMIEQYLEAGIGERARYSKVYSGFDLTRYLESDSVNIDVRAAMGIDAGDFVVGMIARLFKLKGHDDLFAAAAGIIERVPNVKFLLVGDGPWRERFLEISEQPPLKGRFVFTGLVPPERIPELIGTMDILVHLSVREGLPRALPQALAAGRPVVAYDCDGAREVCISDKTGYLIARGDIETLKARIVKLALNPGLRIEMGGNGRSMVKTMFARDRLIGDQLALYSTMLERVRKDKALNT